MRAAPAVSERMTPNLLPALLLVVSVAAHAGAATLAPAKPAPRPARKAVPAPPRPPAAMTPPAPACAARLVAWDGAAADLPFGPGESLGYVVEVGGVYAARLDIETGSWTRDGGVPRVEVIGRAATNSFFSQIHRAVGSLTTQMRGRELASAGFVRELEVGEADVREQLTIDPATGAGSVHYKRDNFLPVDVTLPVRAPGGVEDVLSGLFRMRTQPLKPGDRLCFDVFGQARFWRVTGEVVRSEGVWTRAGYFDAVLLKGEAVRHGDGRGPARYPLEIWLSDDRDRFPIRMKSDSPFGPMVADLDTYRRRHTRRTAQR
jgi:hypothetical protein